jgi:hypothetical protein
MQKKHILVLIQDCFIRTYKSSKGQEWTLNLLDQVLKQFEIRNFISTA